MSATVFVKATTAKRQPSPTMAFDDMDRLRTGARRPTRQAFDEAVPEVSGPDRATKVRVVLALLKDEVSPEDLDTTTTLLNGAGQAQDQPPAFPGKPIPGGGQVPIDRHAAQATDAQIALRDQARASFGAAFPMALRIGRV